MKKQKINKIREYWWELKYCKWYQFWLKRYLVGRILCILEEDFTEEHKENVKKIFEKAREKLNKIENS